MFRSRKSSPDVPDDASAPVAAEAFPVATLPTSGVFLGTLRSEVDEPDVLAEPFERLAVVAEGIVGAYRRHALSETETAERLQVLRMRSAENVEWTIGPTSMRWYRKLPGGMWKPAVPPSKADDALASSADQAIEAVAAMVDTVETVPATFAPTPEPLTPAFPAVETADPTPAADLPSPGDFGVDEDPDDGPVSRDWSFSESDEDDEPVAVQVFPTEPTSMRRTLPTLQALPVTEEPASAGGYGYGYEEPAEDFSTSSETGIVPGIPPIQPAGEETTDEVAETGAGAGEDEELRAMLAALSQETGIALTGFDQPS